MPSPLPSPSHQALIHHLLPSRHLPTLALLLPASGCTASLPSSSRVAGRSERTLPLTQLLPSVFVSLSPAATTAPAAHRRKLEARSSSSSTAAPLRPHTRTFPTPTRCAAPASPFPPSASTAAPTPLTSTLPPLPPSPPRVPSCPASFSSPSPSPSAPAPCPAGCHRGHRAAVRDGRGLAGHGGGPAEEKGWGGIGVIVHGGAARHQGRAGGGASQDTALQPQDQGRFQGPLRHRAQHLLPHVQGWASWPDDDRDLSVDGELKCEKWTRDDGAKSEESSSNIKWLLDSLIGRPELDRAYVAVNLLIWEGKRPVLGYDQQSVSFLLLQIIISSRRIRYICLLP